MITKEQFNEIWKDSSRESILNQFYYEHIELLKMLEEKLYKYTPEKGFELVGDEDVKDKKIYS